jgi:hypothetical protein
MFTPTERLRKEPMQEDTERTILYPRPIPREDVLAYGFACEYCGAKSDLEFGIRGVPSTETKREQGEDDRLVIRCDDVKGCNDREPNNDDDGRPE